MKFLKSAKGVCVRRGKEKEGERDGEGERLRREEMQGKRGRERLWSECARWEDMKGGKERAEKGMKKVGMDKEGR